MNLIYACLEPLPSACCATSKASGRVPHIAASSGYHVSVQTKQAECWMPGLHAQAQNVFRRLQPCAGGAEGGRAGEAWCPR